jgi:spectinomycin phosphotransferase
MKDLPEEFDAGSLNRLLNEHWDFDVASAEYAPLGFGSYHWIVADPSGARGFVNVDDLDRKPWLGDTRDAACAGLERAFDTAVALRDSGLGFIAAPVATNDGASLVRAGARYTVALFPLLAGRAGRNGSDYGPGDRAAIAEMLAELHRVTVEADPVDLELAGRRELEDALHELDHRWSGGPFSEPARAALAEHAADVARALALYDRLGGALPERGSWVVTHGEPHAANVVRTTDRLMLIDWDTVGLAPPERDLWMLGDDTEATARYCASTGRRLDPAATEFFRLQWDLADLAAFTAVLRSTHTESADTQKAYDGLLIVLARAG